MPVNAICVSAVRGNVKQVGNSELACAAGVSDLQSETSKSAAALDCRVFIRSMMFDESQFALQVSSRSVPSPLASYPVLCSHAQWTTASDSGDTGETQVRDEHISRPPKPSRQRCEFCQGIERRPGWVWQSKPRSKRPACLQMPTVGTSSF